MGSHWRPLGSIRLLSSCGTTRKARTTAATASLPSVRDPGEKCGPMARMPTNAEAHSTTVTTMAATPRAFTGVGAAAGEARGWRAGLVEGMSQMYGCCRHRTGGNRPCGCPRARMRTKSSPSVPGRDTPRLVRKIIWIALALIVLGGVAWYAIFAATKPQQAAPPAADAGQLVRADSHRLTAPAEEKAQLVEFLDFECPSCGAVHPFVEELKAEFGDRITFVNRYFPLSAHPNSGQAALAAEAAAQQGQY